MTTTSVNVGFRPMRIGCLVRRGALDDVVKAAMLNTLVWGGRCNSIIPVDDDVERASQLVRRSRVDVLFPVGGSSDVDAVIERFAHLRTHGGGDDALTPIGDDEMGAVTIRLLVSHYYESVFRHAPDQSRAILPVWDDAHPLGALFTLMLGRYMDEAPGPRCRRAFIEGLRAEEATLPPGLPHDFHDYVAPIDFTADQLRPEDLSNTMRGIVLGDPTNPDHLARSGICAPMVRT